MAVPAAAARPERPRAARIGVANLLAALHWLLDSLELAEPRRSMRALAAWRRRRKHARNSQVAFITKTIERARDWETFGSELTSLLGNESGKEQIKRSRRIWRARLLNLRRPSSVTRRSSLATCCAVWPRRQTARVQQSLLALAASRAKGARSEFARKCRSRALGFQWPNCRARLGVGPAKVFTPSSASSSLGWRAKLGPIGRLAD